VKRSHLAAFSVAAVALLAAWTQNTQSDWFKGIIYAGSGKVQLTDATGRLATQGTIAASGNVTIGGTLAVSGATTLTGNVTEQGNETLSGNSTIGGTLAVSGATSMGAVTATTVSTASLLVTTSTNSITAFSGGGQASATQLAAGINRITTVAAAGDSVKLPVAVVGQLLVVSNSAATNSMNLFPATSGFINNLAVNTQLAVAAGKTVTCWGSTTLIWVCSGP